MSALQTCGAKTRAGHPCRTLAMTNGRCRMHGGKAGAPKGNRNAFKHGRYTAEAIAKRKRAARIQYFVKAGFSLLRAEEWAEFHAIMDRTKTRVKRT